jgi:hypothetical protein
MDALYQFFKSGYENIIDLNEISPLNINYIY